ncbi:AfsR/SARP family transcriptional regulator [Longispora albida]|uniref:AfsR/SARP family transcriptional regulator n=1 Tax=Longispora albida TaxID=203523 RepID=UPI000365C176|nr:BTAD domain-containing putative transcriptional regulator [Longispora albida]
METQFRLLGPLEVRSGGAALTLGAPKQRAMLAVLVLEAPAPVSLRKLTELLWEGTPPASATANLRTYAAGLRQLLGPSRLLARDQGYQLRVEPGESDLDVFTRLVAEGRAAADPALTVAALGQALALWRGPAGDQLPAGPLLGHRLAALDESRLLAAEEYTAARLALGAHTELIPGLRITTAEHPLRERSWEHLMLAVYRGGDPAGALAVYSAARRALQDLLGVEPGPGLQKLQAAVLARDPVLTPVPVVVPRQLPPVPPLTGRADDLAAILRAARAGGALIAVDGTGGVGKSTLALHAAHRLAGDFPGGQLYIDLQGAHAGLPPVEPGEALGRFLRAFGDPGVLGDTTAAAAEEAAGRFRTLLAGRRVLIVLDNAASAAQVRPLLTSAPQCAVIVTSRRVLSTLDATARVSLDVLPAGEAVALLGPLGDEQAAREIAELCGGLPLALRIAAARLTGRPDRTAAALAARLRDERRRLDELGLDELAVRSSLAVSYAALATDAGQLAARAFPALGLLKLAEIGPEVTAALLETSPAEAAVALDQLAGERLIEPCGPGRYKMHDLLRLFAAGLASLHLGREQRTAAMRRVLGYYVRAAATLRAELRPLLKGSPLLGFVAGLPETEVPAVRGAAGVTAWFAQEEASVMALLRQSAEDDELATYTIHLGGAINTHLAANNARAWREASELTAAAARRIGDVESEARAMLDLGGAHGRARRFGEARECLRRGLELAAGLDVERFLLDGLGITALSEGEHDEALACLSRSLALHQAIGDRVAAGITLHNLGDLSVELGRYAEGVERLTACLVLRRENGDLTGETRTLLSLGRACSALGDTGAGLAYYAEGLRLCRQTGSRLHEWNALLARAPVLAGLGQADQARADLETALALCEELGDEAGEAEVRQAMTTLGTS